MRKIVLILVLLMFLVGCSTLNGIFKSEDPEPVIEEVKEEGFVVPTEVTVSMKDGVFDNSDVMIKKGGTVTWVNDDTEPYFFTIYTTIEDERSKSIEKTPSEQIGPGEKFEHTFETLGEHKLIPLWHGSLRGRVVVVE